MEDCIGNCAEECLRNFPLHVLHSLHFLHVVHFLAAHFLVPPHPMPLAMPHSTVCHLLVAHFRLQAVFGTVPYQDTLNFVLWTVPLEIVNEESFQVFQVTVNCSQYCTAVRRTVLGVIG